jgi:hypothetical protein
MRLFFNFYDKFIELFNFLFTNTRGNKTHKKIPQKLLILPFCGIVKLKFFDVQTRRKYQKIKLKIEKLISIDHLITVKISLLSCRHYTSVT